MSNHRTKTPVGVHGVVKTRRAEHLQEEVSYLCLEFDFRKGARREEFIRFSDTRSRKYLTDLLMDRGFWPTSDNQIPEILNYIKSELPEEVCYLTNKVGWNIVEDRGEQYAAYVLAHRCIRAEGCPEVILVEGGRRVRGTDPGGTLEDWQEYLAKPAATSSYAVFVICAALAGYLLHFTDLESGMFHLGGPSAAGKTTLARVAASVSPEGPAAVKNWNRTAKSFGPLFLRHNDGFLILDDLALASPGKTQQRDVLHAFAYELTATETRQYSPLLDRAAPQGSYRLLGLSTGEKSAAEIAALAGDARLAGEEARFIDLPARKQKTGVFDRLQAAGHRRTAKHSAVLAKAMFEASEKYYGTAGPAFLERIVEDQERVRERTNRYMEEFLLKARVPAGGWERRFALKFAIVYAAGRLASKLDVLPWSERLIFSCVKRAYRRARGAVPMPVPTPPARISFDQLRGLLSEDRVVNLLNPITPVDAKAANRAEILRLDYRGEVCFAITQKTLQTLGRKPEVERLLQQLDAAGLLVRPSDYPDYRTCQIKPQKGAKRRRFYVVLESVQSLDP